MRKLDSSAQITANKYTTRVFASYRAAFLAKPSGPAGALSDLFNLLCANAVSGYKISSIDNTDDMQRRKRA